jgi:hypothetical protein
MQALCDEVQKFISACEHIQSLLARGEFLSTDEKGVIQQSACELLVTVVKKPNIGS